MDKCNKKILFQSKMMVSYNKVKSAKPNPSATKTRLLWFSVVVFQIMSISHVQGLRSEILMNANHKALTRLLFHTVRSRAGDKIDLKAFINLIDFQKSEIVHWPLVIKGSKCVPLSVFHPWSWVNKHSLIRNFTSFWPSLPILQYPSVCIAMQHIAIQK